MPFFGCDWRAHGDRWIRTEFGWKRLSDIHSTLQRQIGRVASSVMAPVTLRSRSGSPGSNVSDTRSSSRTSSMANSPDSPYRRNLELNEHRLQLHLSLAQRCVSARGCSRESNQYTTVSDAINKLNFSQALLDSNCYPFICEVVERVFVDHYCTLSGSMQLTLLRLTTIAKDIALERGQQTKCVQYLIDKEIQALEKGRAKAMTGFSVSRLDTMIKNLLNYRSQLTLELQKEYASELPCLPNDCWRHIISFLTHPQDVLNLGCANRTFHFLTSESSVWKALTEHHYGRDTHIAKESKPDYKTFKTIYNLKGKQLKADVSSALVLCQVCNFVYWREYGHPCTVSMQTCTQPLTNNFKAVSSRLTAQQFLQLFQY